MLSRYISSCKILKLKLSPYKVVLFWLSLCYRLHSCQVNTFAFQPNVELTFERYPRRFSTSCFTQAMPASYAVSSLATLSCGEPSSSSTLQMGSNNIFVKKLGMAKYFLLSLRLKLLNKYICVHKCYACINFCIHEHPDFQSKKCFRPSATFRKK